MIHIPPRRSRAVHPAIWPAAGIALLVLVNVGFDLLSSGGPGVFGPGAFLHLGYRNGELSGAMTDILHHGAKTIIVAVGMALVLAGRGVDLSVGATMAIAGAACAAAAAGGLGWPAAVGLGLAAGLLCGAWNGMLVTIWRVPPFVATLILMVAGRGVAQMITDGQVLTFRNTGVEFVTGGHVPFVPLPLPFVLALLVVALASLAMRRTGAGLLLEATGGNPEAARLAGVRTGVIVCVTYIASGACAGLAGVLGASEIKAADPGHAGLNMELWAIFAAVVGGTALTGGRFSLLGAACGAILMQTLTTTMYARDVSAEVAPLPGALLVLAISIASSPAVRDRLRQRRATA